MKARTDSRKPRILIIRRENIGDLACTTPLIALIRRNLPGSFIACLVNSYNVQVLEGNPDVDQVYCYTKLRHRNIGRSWFSIVLENIRLTFLLRACRFDYALLATTDFKAKDVRLVKLTGAKHLVALVKPSNPMADVDVPVSYDGQTPEHIVEQLAVLASPFGQWDPAPPLRVVQCNDAVSRILEMARASGMPVAKSPIGIHISARNASQRWPAANFVQLLKRLNKHHGTWFILLWSPGAEDNPFHPGDDGKAAEIVSGLEGVPVFACATNELRDLIAALYVCSVVVCSDGGAQHLAAGLGKPIVSFFGTADPSRWHPWKVPHIVIRPETKDVSDASVDEAFHACDTLLSLYRGTPVPLPHPSPQDQHA